MLPWQGLGLGMQAMKLETNTRKATRRRSVTSLAHETASGYVSRTLEGEEVRLNCLLSLLNVGRHTQALG